MANETKQDGCGWCGAQLVDMSRYCSEECVGYAAEEAMPECSGCGDPLPEGEEICADCDEAMREDAADAKREWLREDDR